MVDRDKDQTTDVDEDPDDEASDAVDDEDAGDDEEEDAGDDEEEDAGDDEEEDAGDDEEEDAGDVEEEQEEIEELYEEVDQLRARVAELESELSRREKEASASRWWTWILGTFAAASVLALVVIFLGQGFPVLEQGVEQGVDPSHQQEQQQALYTLLNEHADELQTCFDAWVGESGATPGTIVRSLIEVDAGQDGNVAMVNVTGDGLAPSFALCLREAVQSWTFPQGGGRFALEAPFEVQGSQRAADAGAVAEGGSSTEAGASPTPTNDE